MSKKFLSALMIVSLFFVAGCSSAASEKKLNEKMKNLDNNLDQANYSQAVSTKDPLLCTLIDNAELKTKCETETKVK